MADVHLPPTLTPLFADLPRRVEIEAANVTEMLERLEERWPGLRDRLCASRSEIRPHIHVYVDKERAQLDSSIGRDSRVDVIAAISGG
jgi:molybdopterin synthase sulfur carrier subunit